MQLVSTLSAQSSLYLAGHFFKQRLPKQNCDVNILAEWRVWTLVDGIGYSVLVIIIVLSRISATVTIPVVFGRRYPIGFSIRTIVIDILEAVAIVIRVFV